MAPNTPVIECKGRLMLASQYKAPNKKHVQPPYVFFYQVGDVLEICLDGKTYGNDGRFCRRSAAFNAELKHVIDKGSLHLFIVAVKSIDKNQEILLPPDIPDEPLPSINADLREIKKPLNGLLNSPEEAPLKKKKKVKVMLKSPASTKNERKTTKKTPAKVKSEPPPPEKPVPVKKEIKKEEPEVEAPAVPIKDETLVNGIKEEDIEEEDDEEKPVASPLKNGPTKGSPTKMGLPDSSGLIVGVNTINYDASSSVKNKAKSREERKMEMIMKAFEAMEKAEQRKKETVDEKPPSKRRRSSSSYKNDSNLEASSADESKPIELKRNRKKGVRKTPGSTPQRRRSRVKSGDSASNISADETPSTPDLRETNIASPATVSAPFRFPKTKKSLMSDWLQESESNLTANEDDDVSANYLKGSRSPPGISTHLLRSAAQSPNKNVCSAKKRWLRQAISEDHSDDLNGAALSPSNNETIDNITPLKKRRLANYKEDQQAENEAENEAATESSANSESPSPVKVPNGLKKQILQNLVLEAVLDKAMEDMLSTPPSNEPANNEQQQIKNETKMEVKKEEIKEEVSNTTTTTTNTLNTQSSPEQKIKAPEPNSAFKSFFNSNVSLEAVEAEIAALKKQRESTVVATTEVKNMTVIDTKEEVVKKEQLPGNIISPTKNEIKIEERPQTAALISPLNKTEIEKSEVKEETVMKSSEQKTIISMSTTEVTAKSESMKTEETKIEPLKVETKTEFKTEVPSSSSQQTSSIINEKPKVKKRLSLADYKSLRKASNSNNSSTCSTPVEVTPSTLTATSLPPLPAPLSTVITSNTASSSQDPGTPTQDEKTTTSMASSNVGPLLNTLPLFDKMDKLDLAKTEGKGKGIAFLTYS